MALFSVPTFSKKGGRCPGNFQKFAKFFEKKVGKPNFKVGTPTFRWAENGQFFASLQVFKTAVKQLQKSLKILKNQLHIDDYSAFLH